MWLPDTLPEVVNVLLLASILLLYARVCVGVLGVSLPKQALDWFSGTSVQVIQEYENGKAIPAPAVLSKLSRVLGVQLSVKKK